MEYRVWNVKKSKLEGIQEFSGIVFSNNKPTRCIAESGDILINKDVEEFILVPWKEYYNNFNYLMLLNMEGYRELRDSMCSSDLIIFEDILVTNSYEAFYSNHYVLAPLDRYPEKEFLEALPWLKNNIVAVPKDVYDCPNLGVYEIKGRGTVYQTRSPIKGTNDDLLTRKVRIDGKVYKVRGIESFADAYHRVLWIGKEIGLLVGEPIDTE